MKFLSETEAEKKRTGGSFRLTRDPFWLSHLTRKWQEVCFVREISADKLDSGNIDLLVWRGQESAWKSTSHQQVVEISTGDIFWHGKAKKNWRKKKGWNNHLNYASNKKIESIRESFKVDATDKRSGTHFHEPSELLMMIWWKFLQHYVNLTCGVYSPIHKAR